MSASRAAQVRLFASNFLRDPYMLGSIVPSSPFLVNAVPLGSMPKWLQSAIAIASREAHDSRGEFLVYQFTSRVLPVLRETFRNLRRGFGIRDLPPAQFFVCSDA